MSATTDSLAEIKFDMFNQPGISNLLQIESLITNTPLQQVILEWAGKSQYGELKKCVANSVQSFLSNFQNKVSTISDESVEDILQNGETYANQIANQKLHLVQTALGLRHG